MEQTAFYVVGIALVVVALITAAIGLRFESFPASRAVLAGGIGVFVVVVAATAAAAVINARDEQNERRVELAEEAAGEEALEAEQTGEEGPDVAGEQQAEQAGPSGEQLFADQGCGSCHALAAAGSTGTIGPDLDQTLRGQSESYIRESIVDPDAEIAQGFQPGVMPQTFGEELSPEEIDALVTFVAESVGAKSQ